MDMTIRLKRDFAKRQKSLFAAEARFTAKESKIPQHLAISRGVTSRVMAAAFNGNFEIVLPCKPDRRNDITG
jgi:hypothetical protein